MSANTSILLPGPNSNILALNSCDRCTRVFDAIANYPRWPSPQVAPLDANTIAFPRLDRPQRPDNPAILIDFHNIHALQASARRGCHLCKLITTELDSKEAIALQDELVRRPETARNQLKILVWRHQTQLVVRLQEGKSEPNSLAPRTLLDFKYREASLIPVYRNLFATSSSSTASYETFSKVHHWLWECDNNHIGCIQARMNRQSSLPTRLIHVGSFASNSVVRLVESTRIPSENLKRRYITLSHCWGSGQECRLTTAQYQNFQSGLETSTLPKTFRDAITLTRYLGMNYIWIDSMCIIQDSNADWTRESARMSEVYSGSFLNIGANSSRNANGGIFFDRDPYTVSPLRKMIRWPPGRETDQMVAFFPAASVQSHIERGPLAKRAWVAQERLLAPRTLHYTRHKVVWECPTMTVTETDVSGELEGPSRAMPSHWTSLSPGSTSTRPRGEICLGKWDSAVRMYTQGELTFQSDKLRAVMGLASSLQNMWNDPSVRYYAGIWTYQMEISLLWHVFGDGLGIADSQAPSWSWASRKGKVSLARLTDHGGIEGSSSELLSNIVSVSTRPIDHPLGPVSSGHVLIRGRLCVATASRITNGEQNKIQINGTEVNARIYLDNKTLPDVAADQPNTLYLLGIHTANVGQIYLRGLILVRHGDNRGEYRRIGYWETVHSDMNLENERLLYAQLGETAPTPEEASKDFDLIMKAFKSMNVPDEAYQERHFESKVYTIMLV